ncbi:MAG: hypothetical protein K2Y21_14605 [Phycisphaerales bacterium]|nr:hypothetical protein [Phycisphaerales bacterium]
MNARTLSLLLVPVLVVVLAACSREPSYSQSSPDATITTAKEMVRRGDAKLLVKLIYSEDENMKKCLNRLGHALGRMQELAKELERAFPAEVAKLREDAKREAAKGGSQGLASLFAGGGQRAREQARRAADAANRDTPAGSNSNDPFTAVLTRLFTSPYEVLEDERNNLTALQLDDKTYTLLYKNGPIVPGVALTIRKDERDGRWYFVIPTDLPILKGYFFKSDEAWRTYTGLVATFDNIVKDLIDDVRQGKVKNLNDTARVAGEKAFTSLPFAFIAIDRLTAAERKREGLTKPKTPEVKTPALPAKGG